MKFVTQASDVPKGTHFVILEYKTSSYYVEGDERSKTHPGHGYPGGYETENKIYQLVTEDKEEWESQVKHMLSNKADFVFFRVDRLGTAKVEIELT
jgi:hypothetical protein